MNRGDSTDRPRAANTDRELAPDHEAAATDPPRAAEPLAATVREVAAATGRPVAVETPDGWVDFGRESGNAFAHGETVGAPSTARGRVFARVRAADVAAVAPVRPAGTE